MSPTKQDNDDAVTRLGVGPPPSATATAGSSGRAGNAGGSSATGGGGGGGIPSPLRNVSSGKAPQAPPSAWSSRSISTTQNQPNRPPSSLSKATDMSSTTGSDISDSEDGEGEETDGDPTPIIGPAGVGSSGTIRGRVGQGQGQQVDEPGLRTPKSMSSQGRNSNPPSGLKLGPNANQPIGPNPPSPFLTSQRPPNQRQPSSTRGPPPVGSTTPLLGPSGGARRPSRTRFNSVGGKTPGPSRSVSRARGADDDDEDDDEDSIDPSGTIEDDEVSVRDRGEELVRKRMKERKKARRMASRLEAGGALPVGLPNQEGGNWSIQGTTSVPPTPRTTGPPSGIRSRAASRSRAPELEGGIDGSAFGRETSVPPRGRNPSGGGVGSVVSTPGGDGDRTPRSPGQEGMSYFPQFESAESGATLLVPGQRATAPPTGLVRGHPILTSDSETVTEDEEGEAQADVDAFSSTEPQGRFDVDDEDITPGQDGNLSASVLRNGKRAASIMSDVVDEVVRDAEAEMEEEGDEDEDADEGDDSGNGDDEGVTLRDRQDAINIEHPFGLPIWKPALYKKSRSVTRNAEYALHAIPSAAAERHLLPGNVLWTILFGWWLALLCFALAVVIAIGEFIGGGGGGYARTIAGLGWYIGWPFGKYVEGDGGPKGKQPDEEALPENEDEDDELYGDQSFNSLNGSPEGRRRIPSEGTDSINTIRHLKTPDDEPLQPGTRSPAEASSSHPSPESNGSGSQGGGIKKKDFVNLKSSLHPTERHSLLPKAEHLQSVSFAKSVDGEARHSLYGAINAGLKSGNGGDDGTEPFARNVGFMDEQHSIARTIGMLVYWPVFLGIIAPTMTAVCLLCWGMVITIPMAKLTWALLKLLYKRPLEIHFRSAPKIAVPNPPSSPEDDSHETAGASSFTIKRARLKAGQVAPTSGARSTVLLCVYRAVGMQYYKYTVGGVNIMFVNLLPLVFFTIFDASVLLPILDNTENPHPFFAFIASRPLIFVLALSSVIPLSYFIGMAVASISAQSSIGMGAVINATFGSIIEIILYGIALTQGKGRLVEGSIVGSILAGVLLMPGMSMVSGAFKRKEQKFNAKSAGVTSTMLIMAIIGTLTPTLFYQTYGSFQLRCDGCPDDSATLPGGIFPGASPVAQKREPWMCGQCYYDHPDPAVDPFYQDQVKTLMYFCAIILVLSYLIGLWFSLRTHASQIWQNPQQLMKLEEVNAGAIGPSNRASLYQRLTPQAVMQNLLPTHRGQEDLPGSQSARRDESAAPVPRREGSVIGLNRAPLSPARAMSPSTSTRRRNYSYLPTGQTPLMDSFGRDGKPEAAPLDLPASLTTEDFTRAVAHATVSALRQHSANQRVRPTSGQEVAMPAAEEEHGGHEGPSWSRGISAAVLLSCTVLYALIAEALVDVVDVVLDGSGIDEKFLGITLFALVPNTTEFMNAMSFALNGNIMLSMEIGSAYALQVCLLQIPAMVAFSAFYDPGKLGDMIDTFTLIFPRWDVIAIILSIFLLTYTYIEARANYHRGSILVLAYLVLVAGFYFAPPNSRDGDSVIFPPQNGTLPLVSYLTNSQFLFSPPLVANPESPASSFS